MIAIGWFDYLRRRVMNKIAQKVVTVIGYICMFTGLGLMKGPTEGLVMCLIGLSWSILLVWSDE